MMKNNLIVMMMLGVMISGVSFAAPKSSPTPIPIITAPVSVKPTKGNPSAVPGHSAKLHHRTVQIRSDGTIYPTSGWLDGGDCPSLRSGESCIITEDGK